MSSDDTRRTPRRLGLLAGALAALLAAGTVTGAHAAEGCRVDYAVQSQWTGGFTATVRVTNLGDPIDGWSLGWTFPSGQRVTRAWNATVTSSGVDVTAAHASYNAHITTDASVSFGFNGSWTSGNTAPTAFTLNGVTCTGRVGGEPQPAHHP